MLSICSRNDSTRLRVLRTARWFALLLRRQTRARASVCTRRSSNTSPNVSLHCSTFLPHRGLANGTFTVFSSDHCPFRYDDPHGKPTGILEHEESQRSGDCVSGEASTISLDQLVRTKTGAFRFIPNGIPGVETRLSLLFTNGVCAGKITLQRFVELTSTNVAKLVSALSLCR